MGAVSKGVGLWGKATKAIIIGGLKIATKTTKFAAVGIFEAAVEGKKAIENRKKKKEIDAKKAFTEFTNLAAEVMNQLKRGDIKNLKKLNSKIKKLKELRNTIQKNGQYIFLEKADEKLEKIYAQYEKSLGMVYPDLEIEEATQKSGKVKKVNEELKLEDENELEQEEQNEIQQGVAIDELAKANEVLKKSRENGEELVRKIQEISSIFNLLNEEKEASNENKLETVIENKIETELNSELEDELKEELEEDIEESLGL